MYMQPLLHRLGDEPVAIKFVEADDAFERALAYEADIYRTPAMRAIQVCNSDFECGLWHVDVVFEGMEKGWRKGRVCGQRVLGWVPRGHGGGEWG